MRICGIDPGANGAICVLDNKAPAYIALLDLKKYSTYDIAEWLRTELLHPDGYQIWIEKIHSLYGMSAKSNFSFGRNLGTITAIAEIVGHHQIIKTVPPKIWQRFVGVTERGKRIKIQVANIATALYPTANLRGKQGGLLDGRSDALMIAHYGLYN